MTMSNALAAAGLLVALSSLGGPVRAATPLAPTDATFATQTVQGGMAEIADARLAMRKSKDPTVLSFARRMVADHGAADAELAAILTRKGIAPSTTVGPANLLTHGKLDVLSGTAFDRAYLKAQRTGHEQSISLFRQEIASGRDPQLVAFARARMVTVMAHLAMLDRRSSM